jgi:peptide/nickel transport system permease protein
MNIPSAGSLKDKNMISRLSNLKINLKQLPVAPMSIICIIIFIAVFAPLLTSHSPTEPSVSTRLKPPSKDHLLGTDSMGRDLFTRLLYGARISLMVAVLTLTVGGGVGLVIGLSSGYFGGKLDILLSRLIDVTLSFPTIFFALLFSVTVGAGLKTVVIAISMVTWARVARVIRGDVLSIKERDFVAQAKVIGCSHLRIIWYHILPNVLNTFMVIVSLDVGWIIIVEAILSFLGAGIPPPTPSWGAMVAEGRGYLTSAWWVSLIPGGAIMLTVLSLNLFGDWLRDFLDPKLKEQM